MTWTSSLLLGFAVSAATIAALAVANRRLPHRRIHRDLGTRPTGIRYYGHVSANLAASGAMVFAFCWFFESWLFHNDHTTPAIGVAQWGAAITLYDLLDYALHRWLFHGHGWLQRMHATHHVIRRPTAPDSLYLRPLETALSLFLLIASCLTVGPISPPIFLAIFSTYTVLNINAHSGLNIPFFPFRALTYMAKKHDLHHSSMKRGNYASMTPVFDMLFGTHE